ncbi:hypothetical protein AB0K60_32470 [Thermopolyspora sp. NPDC052614]|uniref:hypothetical protein n=1 Tax=Thermopolyspora sp. NPDC052614 TaxID=3155682 RepID=UPI003425B3ED
MVDLGEPLLDLGLRPLGVAYEVEVAILLGVQLLQASSEPLTEYVHTAQLVDEGVVELAA